MCDCQKHSDADAVTQHAEGVTFEVQDMTCGHCAGTIRKSIEAALPNSTVTIDLDGKRVTGTGDAAIIKAAIASAGYTPQRAAH